jgi:hypothetical protein
VVGGAVAGSGAAVPGGPGPGFHCPNGFAPGASFCLRRVFQPGTQDLFFAREPVGVEKRGERLCGGEAFAVSERAQRGQRQAGVRARQASGLEAEAPVPAKGGALEAGMVVVAAEEDQGEGVGWA